MKDVDVVVTIISAHATCTNCRWTADGKDVGREAVTHVRDTGHRIGISSHTITKLKPKR